MQNGQHTIILLDIDHKNSMPMRISEALEIIKEAQATKGTEILGAEARIIIMANLGREDKTIKYLKIAEVGADISKELEGKQISLIVPGSLSFAEEENLRRATS
jgi:diphthamide biosynthesis methyltransferase